MLSIYCYHFLLLSTIIILHCRISVGRLRACGFSLPRNSLLLLADEAMKLRGGLSGEFGVDVKPTKYNSKRLCDTTDLYSRIVSLLARLGHDSSYKPLCGSDMHCLAMTGGVKLNGRLYAQGAVVEYLETAVEYQEHCVVRRLGTIGMFYHVRMEGPGQREALFVAVKDRPVTGKVRSMHITPTFVEDGSKPKFKFVLTESHLLLHVDSISAKVMLVPHFDHTLAATHMCGLKMWEAM
jgi:hypothetical protein